MVDAFPFICSSVMGHYINSRPSVQAWMGILLRVSCNFVADGAKNGLQG